MPARTDSFELGRLRLTSGEGRRLVLEIALDPLEFGGQTYAVTPPTADATLDITRTTHHGYALRLRFGASLQGPCMRCLDPARPEVEVDSREVDQPGDIEELRSPYVTDEELDIGRWAHDAAILTLPNQLLCRPDCAGLCTVCGESLNDADPADHKHGVEVDPRWAKLKDLKLE
jgi:uncharacterized protein